MQKTTTCFSILLSELRSCSPTFNGSNWQGRCSVNFSWQMSRCGARILMQLGLQEHHTSIIHLFLSFLPFLLSSTYSSRPTRQQLPALCIAARSFVHRLSSLQLLSNNCSSAKFSLFSWLLCVQHRCNSSVISSINGSGDAWLAGQQSYSSGFIDACSQQAEGKPSFDYYSCFGNSNSR